MCIFHTVYCYIYSTFITDISYIYVLIFCTNRLILKVLSDEVRKPTPFIATQKQGNDTVEMLEITLQLLVMLQEVFVVHPPTNSANNTNNDTAFCTAKTVVFQMVKTVGMEKLLAIIASDSNDTINTETSYIYR